MPIKIRTIIAFILIAVYVLGTSGCAVAWFLVGAGSAATAAAVIDENKKQDNGIK